MSKYDIIIIGSGLGGLECGAILSKEGYHVCVLEKNELFGGCFQTYQRGGHRMDTGIHYIGSLDEGQIMNQYFRYFGIMDKLSIKPNGWMKKCSTGFIIKTLSMIMPWDMNVLWKPCVAHSLMNGGT